MNGGVIMGTSLGDSAYNGLLISVQHHLSQGFSINGNYTWSHCMDDGEVGIDVTAAFQNPANPKGRLGQLWYRSSQDCESFDRGADP